MSHDRLELRWGRRKGRRGQIQKKRRKQKEQDQGSLDKVDGERRASKLNPGMTGKMVLPPVKVRPVDQGEDGKFPLG